MIDLKVTHSDDGRTWVTSRTFLGFHFVLHPGESLQEHLLPALTTFLRIQAKAEVEELDIS